MRRLPVPCNTRLSRCVLLVTSFSAVFVINNYFTYHIQFQNTVHNFHETPLYFESDVGFQKRLQLQDNIKFGGKIKKLVSDVFCHREGLNEPFLDSLPLIRNVTKDFQPQSCKSKTYPKFKERISVVINYRNEVLSLLLRSVYTVINSIPRENFQELILIDDGSDLTKFADLEVVPSLVETFLVPVRYIRFSESKGLIVRRRLGCELAKGDVILVLDSHVEVQEGFVEPLLDELAKDYRTLASPVLDFWDTYDMRYWSYDVIFTVDSYLSWTNHKIRHNNKTYPSATVLGGAFVVTKKFFQEIDYYGRGMQGWGGDNIEIGLKVWYCNGRVVIVPCSRVLHFAARRHPFSHGNRPMAPYVVYNYDIIMESYFTEEDNAEYHKEFKTAGLPGRTDVVEVAKHNRELLKLLNCTKNYRWVRRNITPMVESFDEETLIAHTLKTGTYCIEGVPKNDAWYVFSVECAKIKATRYVIRLTKQYQLRFAVNRCLDWELSRPEFTPCYSNKLSQITKYDPEAKHLKNREGNICLIRYNTTGQFGYESCGASSGLHGPYYIPTVEFKVIYHPHLLRLAD